MIPSELREKIESLITEEDYEAASDEMARLESMGRIYQAKCPKVLDLQRKTMAYMFFLRRTNGFPSVKTVDYSVPILSPVDQQIRIERQNATALMGPDSRYALISASDPNTRQTKALNHLFTSFHFSGKHNILLVGGTGSGKTFAAIAYACASDDFRLYSDGSPRNTAFIRAYALSEAIQRKKWDFLDSVRKKKWLIIDDLGVEGPGYKSGDFLSFFEDMFIERHENQKRTILTCNARLEDIKTTFGERFISRLRETGEVFETIDEDMRVS